MKEKNQKFKAAYNFSENLRASKLMIRRGGESLRERHKSSSRKSSAFAELDFLTEKLYEAVSAAVK